jgi:ribonuclease E
VEVAADGTPRRRRGRRGGRRRRRNEGESTETGPQDQSEIDFEDGDDADDIVIQVAPAMDKPVKTGNAARAVAAAAVVIPVSNAESDFSDLPNPGSTASAPVQPPAPLAETAVAEEKPLASNPAPEMPSQPESETESTTDVVAEVAAVPDLRSSNVPVAVEFVEPLPQQTGYVPVAPPSFAMPSTPNNGFDFTVRISPENKAD